MSRFIHEVVELPPSVPQSALVADKMLHPHQKVRRLIEKYVLPHSEFCVNISSGTRTKLANNWSDGYLGTLGVCAIITSNAPQAGLSPGRLL